ncbi:HdeD family acid-resistance protein [Epilithonimonas hominis]|uniref:HdeD family acid-resistance protein n=1 Tax=Epilithonimonas hominis TaxID=420404 RepID=UPI00289DA42E|nr:DUF308 domain-containing protein [Epilithonimonas hominis]
MATTFFKTIRETVKHWYLPLIIGILLVILGLYMFSVPQATYLSLVLFFSASFLIFGIMELIFAVQNRNNLDNWGWYLVGALLDLFVGIILFFQPQVAFVALPYFIGFSLMFRSIQGIGFAFDLKSYGVLQWGNLALVSLLGLIGSVILILNPLLAGISLVVVTAVAFIFSGISAIILAFNLRQLKNYPGKISQELKDKIESVKNEYHDALKSSGKH